MANGHIRCLHFLFYFVGFKVLLRCTISFCQKVKCLALKLFFKKINWFNKFDRFHFKERGFYV